MMSLLQHNGISSEAFGEDLHFVITTPDKDFVQ